MFGLTAAPEIAIAVPSRRDLPGYSHKRTEGHGPPQLAGRLQASRLAHFPSSLLRLYSYVRRYPLSAQLPQCSGVITNEAAFRFCQANLSPSTRFSVALTT